MRTAGLTTLALCLMTILAGCDADPVAGPSSPPPPADFSRDKQFAESDRYLFRYPVDGLGDRTDPVSCPFECRGGRPGGVKFHAAQDYPDPPGTPVYAIADGEVSFSGPAGGYGWLVIVDHPGPNLYSLYGHLSPSRWQVGESAVVKGDLLGYLGDSHENGGSRENPLRPHLHFGLRAGQRSDYPGKGEWRWQAGWIKPLPTTVGWLRPSDVINAQRVPDGGFTAPRGNLIEVWGIELALVSAYVLCGVCVMISAVRRRRPLLLLIAMGLCVVAGWYLGHRGLQLAWIVYVVAGMLLAAWTVTVLRPRDEKHR